MTDPLLPPAALITTGGVFLPGHLALPIWRVLLGEIARRRGDGGRVRPELAQALEVLRAAAMAHMSAHGHDPRTCADIAPQSKEERLLSTADMATRLRVSERHARRLAREHGIAPVARNLWQRNDVRALEESREG